MGGSGSTGSSLLKNILNRHHDIFSGGETAFFAKKMIYKDWQYAKSRVLRRKFFGLRNYGWHLYNGTDLVQNEYLWNKNELGILLRDSNSLSEFTTAFYERPLNGQGSNIWLEKTPANAACFSMFLDSFKESKAIHMVRNPFDTIASLMRRGFDLYYATGIYLLNTASGISCNYTNRTHTVKYEALISDPEGTVREICSFLGINYYDHMLQPQGEYVDNSQLEGWKYDETKAIGKGSVGRFSKLSSDSQNEILEAVNLIQIAPKGKSYYKTDIANIEQICSKLGYDYVSKNSKSSLKELKILQVKDRFARIRRGYPTGFSYPLEIKR
jgi:hypothetical protein